MRKTIVLFICLLFQHVQFAAIHATTPLKIYEPSKDKDACIIFVPKAFSPNGDGINDKFRIKNACNINEFSLKIYDETSHLIYEYEQVDHVWDGKLNGRPAPEGKYQWTISYKKDNSESASLQGSLVLIR